MLAEESSYNNVPLFLLMAASTSIERAYDLSNVLAWFQLYIGQDENFVMYLVDRAYSCCYKTLILTVDVPILSKRARDDRNGFDVPFKMSFKNFIDFATHPHWSLKTLYNGSPPHMTSPTSQFANKCAIG